jgi:TPR repeat protein
MPTDLHEQVLRVAKELWGEQDIPSLPTRHDNSGSVFLEGEAKLLEGTSFSDRAEQFHSQAFEGCPLAQQSYGSLLWSGFGLTVRDDVASARWHAAAAAQHHLDGMAVLGGCLRTGTGIPVPTVKDKSKSAKSAAKAAAKKQAKENTALGLRLIEYCASQHNPSGVNKQAALLQLQLEEETNNSYDESYSSDEQADVAPLYQACVDRERINALLLFNLGWCHVHGQGGVDRKDITRGEAYWRQAAAMAPDEGSEEAAWNLYEQYQRNDPQEARPWLQLAVDLGYEEAITEQDNLLY